MYLLTLRDKKDEGAYAVDDGMEIKFYFYLSKKMMPKDML